MTERPPWLPALEFALRRVHHLAEGGPDLPQAVRREEAAELLGLRRREVDTMGAHGEIRFVQVGGALRIPLAEVERFLLRRQFDEWPTHWTSFATERAGEPQAPGWVRELHQAIGRLESTLSVALKVPRAVQLKDAAAALSMSPKSMSRLSARGVIGVVTLRGLRRVPVAELERLLRLEGAPMPPMRPTKPRTKVDTEALRTRLEQRGAALPRLKALPP